MHAGQLTGSSYMLLTNILHGRSIIAWCLGLFFRSDKWDFCFWCIGNWDHLQL